MTRSAVSLSNAEVAGLESRLMGYGTSASYRLPVALVRGAGTVVYDVEDRRFLDLFGGAGRCLLGHGDPAFTAALRAQISELLVSRYCHPARGRYAERLVHLAPEGLDHISFFSTGSEAVDAAIRLACHRTRRKHVVVFDGAFHGRTSSVADLTDPRWLPGGAPSATTARRCRYPAEGDPADGCAGARDDVLMALRDGDVAAVMIEPIQATGGNRCLTPGFLRWLSAVCAEDGALLILDEVVTAFGRTGLLFAAAADQVRPDIIVLGKGMANGVPVGAVLTSSVLAAVPPLGSPGGMSSTFGGNPLAVVASESVLDALSTSDLMRRAALMGSRLRSGLAETIGSHPAVAGITGTGLMVGIPLRIRADAAERVFLSHGLLVGVSGRTLRINPPLVITPAEVDEAVATIGDALGALVSEVG
jgi:acetylornithine/N-succinyldiaminopimelate aminotransferase